MPIKTTPPINLVGTGAAQQVSTVDFYVDKFKIKLQAGTSGTLAVGDSSMTSINNAIETASGDGATITFEILQKFQEDGEKVNLKNVYIIAPNAAKVEVPYQRRTLF